ncbi:MAG: PhnD/SsuA/transferrin family substrate-binding protein [Ilumatobacteraceae bacterium]
MIASLAMYPFAQVRDATNDLWAAIRRNLGWGPDALEWNTLTPDVWHEPDLLLAQCCGWPLVSEFGESMAVVGTFDYAVPDSMDGTYRSLIVTASYRSLDELRHDPKTVAAVNDYASLSGWISFQHVWKAELPSFVTGAHRESVRAVGEGRAQVACIDAVSWNLFEEFEPDAVSGLQVIGQGPRIPCLPIMAPLQHEDKIPELRAAIAGAVADPGVADARKALRIRGFVPRDRADYTPVLSLLG